MEHSTTGKFRYLLFAFISFAQIVTAQPVEAFYLKTGHYAELDYPCSYLTDIDFGISFHNKSRVALASEMNFYKFWNPRYSSIGIGLRPAAKFYIQSNEHFFRPYAELKGGIVYMTPEFPFSALNFTFLGEIGIDIRITGGMVLSVAGGYNHFSNGKRLGDTDNPTWDGFGGSIAIIKHKAK